MCCEFAWAAPRGCLWFISPGFSWFHYLHPAMDGTCSSMTPPIAGAALSQSAVVRRLHTVLSRYTIGSLHTWLWGRRVETSSFNPRQFWLLFKRKKTDLAQKYKMCPTANVAPQAESTAALRIQKNSGPYIHHNTGHIKCFDWCKSRLNTNDRNVKFVFISEK